MLSSCASRQPISPQLGILREEPPFHETMAQGTADEFPTSGSEFTIELGGVRYGPVAPATGGLAGYGAAAGRAAPALQFAAAAAASSAAPGLGLGLVGRRPMLGTLQMGSPGGGGGSTKPEASSSQDVYAYGIVCEYVLVLNCCAGLCLVKCCSSPWVFCPG